MNRRFSRSRSGSGTPSTSTSKMASESRTGAVIRLKMISATRSIGLDPHQTSLQQDRTLTGATPPHIHDLLLAFGSRRKSPSPPSSTASQPNPKEAGREAARQSSLGHKRNVVGPDSCSDFYDHKDRSRMPAKPPEYRRFMPWRWARRIRS